MVSIVSGPCEGELQYYVLGGARICHLSSSGFSCMDYAFELLEMEAIYTGVPVASALTLQWRSGTKDPPDAVCPLNEPICPPGTFLPNFLLFAREAQVYDVATTAKKNFFARRRTTTQCHKGNLLFCIWRSRKSDSRNGASMTMVTACRQASPSHDLNRDRVQDLHIEPRVSPVVYINSLLPISLSISPPSKSIDFKHRG